LSPAQKEDLAQWVRNGPDPTTDGVVRWRRVDLNRRFEKRFGVVMHERTVGKQLASLGFRRLSVRPQHPKSNPEAQDTFEKTSRQKQAWHCQRPCAAGRP
jgi:transposase